MSLKEQALSAADTQRRQQANDALAARGRELDLLIENWEERCKWTFRGAIPECPARDEFTRATNVPHDRPRDATYTGWKVTIDEIEFFYSTSYGSTGWHVMATCPDCGAVKAVHLSGLEELGRILKTGRWLFHHCYEREAQSLAAAIGRAARDANMTPGQIIEKALHHHPSVPLTTR